MPVGVTKIRAKQISAVEHRLTPRPAIRFSDMAPRPLRTIPSWRLTDIAWAIIQRCAERAAAASTKNQPSRQGRRGGRAGSEPVSWAGPGFNIALRRSEAHSGFAGLLHRDCQQADQDLHRIGFSPFRPCPLHCLCRAQPNAAVIMITRPEKRTNI